MKTVAFCEIDPFCRKVLRKHWPDIQIFEDITKLRGSDIEQPVDIVCGGFPCQPFSCAGKRKGTEDNRFLWPEMLRIISEVKPAWVIAENVGGLLSQQDGMVFENCCADLENQGYEVQPFIIPACAVGAPHRRDRVWIVGNSNATDSCNQRLQGSEWTRSHDKGQAAHGSITERNSAWDEPWIDAASRLCGVDARVSDRVHRLKALGNSVVPQVVYEIGKAIVKANYQG